MAHPIEQELLAAVFQLLLAHPDTDPALVQEATNPRPDHNRLHNLLVAHNQRQTAALRNGGGQQPQSSGPLSFDNVSQGVTSLLRRR